MEAIETWAVAAGMLTAVFALANVGLRAAARTNEHLAPAAIVIDVGVLVVALAAGVLGIVAFTRGHLLSVVYLVLFTVLLALVGVAAIVSLVLTLRYYRRRRADERAAAQTN